MKKLSCLRLFIPSAVLKLHLISGAPVGPTVNPWNTRELGAYVCM